ncbi:hypothetical protein CPC08DRAFT_706592 [Agrocybe pediades]|nr:hypothetical protein CPC08DRAFT_706592 [Agrocybe pediades]
MPPYLLARRVDRLLGIFTGFLAYYLHENHPRTARKDEDRLIELLKWKYRSYQQKRHDSLLASDESS